MCVYIYIYIYYLFIYIYLYVCVRVHIYIYISVCVHACVHACMCTLAGNCFLVQGLPLVHLYEYPSLSICIYVYMITSLLHMQACCVYPGFSPFFSSYHGWAKNCVHTPSEETNSHPSAHWDPLASPSCTAASGCPSITNGVHCRTCETKPQSARCLGAVTAWQKFR